MTKEEMMRIGSELKAISQKLIIAAESEVLPGPDVMLYLGSRRQSHRCVCGTAVFRRVRGKPEIVRCNGCGEEYESERVELCGDVAPQEQMDGSHVSCHEKKGHTGVHRNGDAVWDQSCPLPPLDEILKVSYEVNKKAAERLAVWLRNEEIGVVDATRFIETFEGLSKEDQRFWYGMALTALDVLGATVQESKPPHDDQAVELAELRAWKERAVGIVRYADDLNKKNCARADAAELKAAELQTSLIRASQEIHALGSESHSIRAEYDDAAVERLMVEVSTQDGSSSCDWNDDERMELRDRSMRIIKALGSSVVSKGGDYDEAAVQRVIAWGLESEIVLTAHDVHAIIAALGASVLSGDDNE